MGKRGKRIGLAVLVALAGVLVACGSMDAGAGPAEVRRFGGRGQEAARAPVVLSRTIQLFWDEYLEASYHGVITTAPPGVPTLRLGVELVQDGEVLHSEMRLTGIEAPTVTGTGQFNGDFVFYYPDFYGEAEEWIGCWWEGGGWSTVTCLPGDVALDERGFGMVGVVEPRPEWRLYLPAFRFGAGGG